MQWWFWGLSYGSGGIVTMLSLPKHLIVVFWTMPFPRQGEFTILGLRSVKSLIWTYSALIICLPAWPYLSLGRHHTRTVEERWNIKNWTVPQGGRRPPRRVQWIVTALQNPYTLPTLVILWKVPSTNSYVACAESHKGCITGIINSSVYIRDIADQNVLRKWSSLIFFKNLEREGISWGWKNEGKIPSTCESAGFWRIRLSVLCSVELPLWTSIWRIVAHKWAMLLLLAAGSLENGFNKLRLQWIILLLLAWQLLIRNQIRLDDYKQKHMISNAA
jgi:hypothetical protein